MSGEVNMTPTLTNLGGPSPCKFGGGQSRDIFRGGPVKKTTLYVEVTSLNERFGNMALCDDEARMIA